MFELFVTSVRSRSLCNSIFWITVDPPIFKPKKYSGNNAIGVRTDDHKTVTSDTQRQTQSIIG